MISLFIRLFFDLSIRCDSALTHDSAMVSQILPQMHHGVATPWTPGLGNLFRLFRTHSAKAVAYRNIFLRKSIRPTRSAHGDVMRRPLADAWQRGQLRDARFRTASGVAF